MSLSKDAPGSSSTTFQPTHVIVDGVTGEGAVLSGGGTLGAPIEKLPVPEQLGRLREQAGGALEAPTPGPGGARRVVGLKLTLARPSWQVNALFGWDRDRTICEALVGGLERSDRAVDLSAASPPILAALTERGLVRPVGKTLRAADTEPVRFEAPLGEELRHLVHGRDTLRAEFDRIDAASLRPAAKIDVGPAPEPNNWANILVHDDLTGIAFPYAAKGRELDAIRAVVGDPGAARTLDRDVAFSLWLARALTTAEAAAQRKANTEALTRDDYLVVRGLLPPSQAAAFRAYARGLRARKQFDFFIFTGPRPLKRTQRVRDPYAGYLHAELQRVLSSMVGERVKPSLSGVCAYEGGAVLPKHIDSDGSIWNISLQIDMDPEETPAWPLFIEKDGDRGFALEAGDALFYRGRRHPHWRDALPDNAECTVTIFSFVPMDATDTLSLDPYLLLVPRELGPEG